MPDLQLDLQLRDIHLPDLNLWWPPAPGWWISAVLLILLLILSPKIWRWLMTKPINSRAKKSLLKIEQAYQRHLDQSLLVKQISEWQRRVVMSYFPRRQVASLTGDAWVVVLSQLNEKSSSASEISREMAQLINQSLYQSSPASDVEQLLKLCQQWAAGLPKTTVSLKAENNDGGSHAPV